MLEPLQKLVRLSPPIAASLAVPEIFTRTCQKLGHKDAVTRLNLLRILRTICDATDEECWLIKSFGVYETVSMLSEHDPAILVRQMAEELVSACDDVGKRSSSRASGFRRPASSMAARAGSGSSTGSGLGGGGSTMTPPTPTLSHSFSMPPTPNIRERGGRSQSSVGILDVREGEREQGLNTSAPLVRAQTAGLLSSSRGSTPTHRPPSRDHNASLMSSGNGKNTGSGKSRLSKARQATSGRTSLANGALADAVSRRRERERRGSAANAEDRGGEEENMTPVSLPKLSIVRRRRGTSNGEEASGSRSAL